MAETSKFLYSELTYANIGAAMTAHRILGKGFLESVYHAAFAYELGLLGLAYQHEVKLTVRYKEIDAGEFRADFIVEDKIVVEIKAISSLTTADQAQIIHYLKATDKKWGCLSILVKTLSNLNVLLCDLN
jgi:GxxExxY protein